MKYTSLLSIVICLFPCVVMAAEEHNVTVTLQNRDLYAIAGKSITLKTYNCQEVANGTPALLVIEDMNKMSLAFENGTRCRVTNIFNANNETFD